MNNTLTPKSNQRLLEIEEKRKKRRIRKQTQQHFRGSSFGHGGSVPKASAELIKAYEYGSNGFTQEESNENVRSVIPNPPNQIDQLRTQVNNNLLSSNNGQYTTSKTHLMSKFLFK